MMQMQKLDNNKFKDFFKDFVQFWPNSRTFKALKMKQFFQGISRMWEPCNGLPTISELIHDKLDTDEISVL